MHRRVVTVYIKQWMWLINSNLSQTILVKRGNWCRIDAETQEPKREHSYRYNAYSCRCCPSYIFIIDFTLGFNKLRKDNCKTRRATFKFWNLVRLILEIWRCNLKEQGINSACLHAAPYPRGFDSWAKLAISCRSRLILLSRHNQLYPGISPWGIDLIEQNRLSVKTYMNTGEMRDNVFWYYLEFANFKRYCFLPCSFQCFNKQTDMQLHILD